MSDGRTHLGVYSDWVEEAARQRRLRPAALPDERLRESIRSILGFVDDSGIPADVRQERAWEHAGVAGEEVSWSVGFGPRTRAWVLKPIGVREQLPGVVALHDHGGIKFFGKEKIADGPDEPSPTVVRLRGRAYGNHAYANELARRGFVVVVHDVFLWGSRRFPLEAMPERIRAFAVRHAEPPAQEDVSAASYDRAAYPHEDLVAKYCALLGTSLAGVVAHDDRAAVNYLRSRPDVLDSRVGCVGLSGGGCRSALLQATCEQVCAAVVVGMMSTHAQLLDDSLIDAHTWMFFPSGMAGVCDWPDLAASRAPSPLLVQYDRQDSLFTLQGMEVAHEMIASRYADVGRPEAYVGEFYDGPHKFDLPMQDAAFGWLDEQLRRSG